MNTLKLGSTGPDVEALQRRLQELGFNPGGVDGDFGDGTQAAVTAFQRSEGLLADGIVGARTATAMGLDSSPEPASAIPAVSVAIVSQMFPATTPITNIRSNLPPVLKSLVDANLVDRSMVLMALATIRAETEGFEPISEYPSKYNTSPGGQPFDLYDNRKDLGNQGAGDGARFRGRGFIQLTGRANYLEHGRAIGLGDQLIDSPEMANDPDIAARLLASFLSSKERAIKEALLHDDLKAARRLVNGGTTGIDRFTDTYTKGAALIADDQVRAAAG